MSDIDRFESRLEAWIQARADIGSRPFDAAAIARSAITLAGRPRRTPGSLDALRAWRKAASPVRLLVIALTVALLVGAGVLVGSLQDHSVDEGIQYEFLTPSPVPVPTPSLAPSPVPAASPGAGVFTPTGSMAAARDPGSFTATLLRDGRVLVVGGGTPETWDPATSVFTATGSPSVRRGKHTATLLDDGRVLVIGGREGGDSEAPSLASAEIWDPATGRFTPTGSLAEGRARHTATLLRDGRVLVVGGQDGDFRDGRRTAELWDPGTGRFTPTGSLVLGRYAHGAALLDDGSVLIVGGDRVMGMSIASAELWDDATGTFSAAGSLAQGRHAPSLTLLDDGRVLVVGGSDDSISYEPLATTELWDPDTRTFSAAASLAAGRVASTATALGDGRVLIVGGSDLSHDVDGLVIGGLPPDRDRVASAELWDRANKAFGPAASLSLPRWGHTATLLRDGRVLVIGGGTDPVSRQCMDGSVLPFGDDCPGNFAGKGSPVPLASAELYVPDAIEPRIHEGGSDDTSGHVPSELARRQVPFRRTCRRLDSHREWHRGHRGRRCRRVAFHRTVATGHAGAPRGALDRLSVGRPVAGAPRWDRRPPDHARVRRRPR